METIMAEGAILRDDVRYHDGPRSISLDFHDRHTKVPAVHGNGMSVDVVVPVDTARPPLITLALALPNWVAAVFSYLNAADARELAASLNSAADRLDIETSKQAVAKGATVN